MSEQEIEFVEVKLRVPKKVDEWFRKEYEDVESHYQWELWDSLRATLDAEDLSNVEGKKALQVLEKAIADLTGEPLKLLGTETSGEDVGKTVKVNLEVRKEMVDLIERLWETNPWMAYESLEEFFEEAGRRYMLELLEIATRNMSEQELPRCRFCGQPMGTGFILEREVTAVSELQTVCDDCLDLIVAIVKDNLPCLLAELAEVMEESLPIQLKCFDFENWQKYVKKER